VADEWKLPYDFDGLAQINRLTGMIGGNVAGGVTIKGSGAMRSDNYVAGSAGWNIDGDGNVEFNSGTFRGDLDAVGGTFTGTISGGTISGGTIEGATINIGSGGFVVESDGTVRVSDGDAEVVIDPSTFVDGSEVRGVVSIYPGSTGWSPGEIVASDAGGLLNPYFAINTPTNATYANRVALVMYSTSGSNAREVYLDLEPTRSPPSGWWAKEGEHFRVFEPVEVPDGSVSDPTLTFSAEQDTGIYRAGSNRLGFACSGIQYAEISTSGIRGPLGSSSFPSFNFMADADTGMYRVNADVLGFTVGGTARLWIDDDPGAATTPSVSIQGTGTRFYVQDGNVSRPGLGFWQEGGMGVFRNASGQMSLVVGSTNVARFDYNSGSPQLFCEAVRAQSISTGVVVEINATTGRMGKTTSSRRFKHSIRPGLSPDLVERAMQVEPVYYVANEDGTPHIGFIAEDFAGVDTRLVTYDADGLVQTYNPKAIVAVLWAEVKRLRELVDA